MVYRIPLYLRLPLGKRILLLLAICGQHEAIGAEVIRINVSATLGTEEEVQGGGFL